MTELDREEKLPFPPHDKVGDYYNKGEIDWINQKLASAKEEGAREGYVQGIKDYIFFEYIDWESRSGAVKGSNEHVDYVVKNMRGALERDK